MEMGVDQLDSLSLKNEDSLVQKSVHIVHSEEFALHLRRIGSECCEPIPPLREHYGS